MHKVHRTLSEQKVESIDTAEKKKAQVRFVASMIVFYQRQYTVAWSILSLTDDFVDSMA